MDTVDVSPDTGNITVDQYSVEYPGLYITATEKEPVETAGSGQQFG